MRTVSAKGEIAKTALEKMLGRQPGDRTVI